MSRTGLLELLGIDHLLSEEERDIKGPSGNGCSSASSRTSPTGMNVESLILV